MNNFLRWCVYVVIIILWGKIKIRTNYKISYLVFFSIGNRPKYENTWVALNHGAGCQQFKIVGRFSIDIMWEIRYYLNILILPYKNKITIDYEMSYFGLTSIGNRLII